MSVLDRLRPTPDGPSVEWPALVGSVLLCELAGVVPSVLTAGDVATWYPTLAKPAFTPPSWVFGPVWTTLYLLMGVALYLVWRRAAGRVRQVALGAFAVQLVLNAAWTLTFFGAREILGGLVVIVACWRPSSRRRRRSPASTAGPRRSSSPTCCGSGSRPRSTTSSGD